MRVVRTVVHTCGGGQHGCERGGATEREKHGAITVQQAGQRRADEWSEAVVIMIGADRMPLR